MGYKIFDKKYATHKRKRINSNSDSENQKLRQGLNKLIIGKFKKNLKTVKHIYPLRATFRVLS